MDMDMDKDMDTDIDIDMDMQHEHNDEHEYVESMKLNEIVNLFVTVQHNNWNIHEQYKKNGTRCIQQVERIA